jgi:hypothetical protein
MTADGDQPYDDLALRRRLYTAVFAYQQARLAHPATTDLVQRDELMAIQQSALEQLYADLHQPLFKLAQGWGRSLMIQERLAAGNSYHDALESLTMSAFGDVAAALPSCKLDPDGNICQFLIQIARNKLHDQQYKVYSDPPRIQQYDKAHEYSMWPPPTPKIEGVWETTTGKEDQSYLAEPEDPASIDFDNQLIRNRDNQTHLRAVLHYWHTELPLEERVIVTLRWMVEQPFSFKAVARCLGKGWTAAAARQRHHRILQRTRRYLIERGLVDPTELGECTQ